MEHSASSPSYVLLYYLDLLSMNFLMAGILSMYLAFGMLPEMTATAMKMQTQRNSIAQQNRLKARVISMTFMQVCISPGS